MSRSSNTLTIADVRIFDPVSGRVSSAADIEIADARIQQFAPPRTARGEFIDGKGAIAIPGLIDAHIHLLATAGRRLAWDIGPRAASSIDAILEIVAAAASSTPPGEWIRAAAYDEWALEEHRHPSREELDRVASEHPVRLTHRSYHACVLNSVAAVRCGLDVPDGLVLEPETVPELALTRLPEPALRRALADVGSDLLSCGITQIHDASPANDAEVVELIADMAGRTPMPKVTLMSDIERRDEVVRACAENPALVRAGHVKVICTDGRDGVTPPLDVLTEIARKAVQCGAGIAIHSVEESTLVVALEAIKATDAPPGTVRIEHGALIPPALDGLVLASGAAVVTNPGFLAESGDRYAATVEPERLPWLYRARSLMHAGIPMAAGSDAPIGPIDPWMILRAAVSRASPGGLSLEPKECLSLPEALTLLTTGAAAVDGGRWGGGRITPGGPADLALLDPQIRHLDETLAMKQVPVRTTVVSGCVLWEGG